jgi:hypothetical protein
LEIAKVVSWGKQYWGPVTTTACCCIIGVAGW